MKPISIFMSIYAAMAVSASGAVTCEEGDGHILITREGRHVLTYHKKAGVPEGVDPKYARSGFIHPISTPSGKVITDGYPLPHHSHQNGLFFAWRKATYEGEAMNFWEREKQTVRHQDTLEIINGESAAGFRVELSHVSGDTVILSETWTVLVHADTGSIDLRSEQRCATDSPLVLEKFHYGGMAIRGSRQWFADGEDFVAACEMLTSEGLSQADGNHSRPEWVCMAGEIDSAPVAVTLIPHPSNFRHPQHVRLHPKMPYFCFIPTVEEPFAIEPGTPWVSRYRILAEDGVPDPAKLNAAVRAFAMDE